MRMELQARTKQTKTDLSRYSKRLLFFVDTEVKREFQLACLRNGQSASEVLRTLVESYLISEKELRAQLRLTEEVDYE